MSTRQKVLLIVCIALAASAWALMWQYGAKESEPSVPSSYSAGPNGIKALYLLLNELHIPVARLRRPFTRLESAHGVLLVVGPPSTPFSLREIGKLKEWVENGNRLILFEGGPRPAREPISLKYGKDFGPSTESRSRPGMARQFGLTLKTTSESSRQNVEVSSPRLAGIDTIDVSGRTRWGKLRKDWSALVNDHAGPVVVSRKLGKGEVVAVSDASIAWNRYLGLEENVRLVLALLLEKGGPREVFFDEYHHGHAVADSFWGYVGSSVFAWVFLQGLVAGALFFYSRRARYAGRFLSLSRPQGRSTMEYVSSMANVFDTSRAGYLALEALLRRFLGRLSRTAGVPLKVLDQETLAKTTVRGPGDIDFTNLIQQCRDEVKSGGDSEQTVKLARELALTQRQWHGGK